MDAKMGSQFTTCVDALGQGSINFLCKGQRVNIFSFVSHATQLCYLSVKAVIRDM